MKTVLELLKLSSKYLSSKGVENPRRSAEDLIAAAFKLNRLDLYLSYELPISESEIEKIRQLIKRRGQGEPTPYILENVEFYGCKLKVNADVLIPRQETEILVDTIVKYLETHSLIGKKLLDLCSGSGCLGLSIKKKFPELDVVLSDICPKALQVAAKNAISNGLEVSFKQGDFLAPLRGESFDFVVCNPPYIDLATYEVLGDEVKKFEPKLALVGGVNGLEFYERFANEGVSFLKPQGHVWFEIGFDQGKSVSQLFQKAPWKNLKLAKDWAGHDRFFSLEIE